MSGTERQAEHRELKTRNATWEDLPHIVQLYCTAFDENPAYGDVFRMSGAAHRQSLEWLFERRVMLLLKAGLPLMVVTDQNNCPSRTTERVVAAAGLVPNESEPGLWAMIRVGLLLWPWRYGFASLKRGLSKPHPPGNAELSMVAVDPEYQGTGVGTLLVQTILKDFGSRFEVGLSTQNPRGPPFYRRFGFEVQSEGTGNESGYMNWMMLRPQPDKQQDSSVS